MKKQTLQKRISKSFILVFCILLTLTMTVAAAISARVFQQQASRLCRQIVSLNLDLLNNQILDLQKSQQNIAQADKVREFVRYCREKNRETTHWNWNTRGRWIPFFICW